LDGSLHLVYFTLNGEEEEEEEEEEG